MAKINRSIKPICLEKIVWDETNQQWFRYKSKQKWEKFVKTKCYKIVKLELMRMCNDTCPFTFVTNPPEIFFEIEHFKPKSNIKFKNLEFEWTNLFPIYRYVNTLKNKTWDDSLQSPGDIDYLEYLFMNKFVGTEHYCHIQPKKQDKKSVDIAQKIIEIYHLNNPKMVAMRKWWFEINELKLQKYPFKSIFNN